jgi:excisionase family DNA binding protein
MTRSTSSSAPKRTTPSLLTIDVVADTFGVTPRFVRRLIAERRIPFVKVGKFVRFDPGELDLWLDEQRVEARRPGSGPRTAAR